MNDKEVRISTLVTVVLAIIMYFFDFRISTGLILGHLFSILHLYVLTKSTIGMFDRKKANIVIVFIAAFLRYVIIALPLVMALLWPNYLNVIATFLGFIVYKTTLVAFAVVNKK